MTTIRRILSHFFDPSLPGFQDRCDTLFQHGGGSSRLWLRPRGPGDRGSGTVVPGEGPRLPAREYEEEEEGRTREGRDMELGVGCCRFYCCREPLAFGAIA